MSGKFRLSLFFLFLLACFLLPVEMLPAQISSNDQVIALKSGFNFVSFTVTPPATTAELISKNSNLEDIYLYSATAGSFLSASEGSLTKLSIGKGYIIKSKADTSVTINGPPAGTIGDISLKKGFNLLGFSKQPSAGGSAALTMSRLLKYNYLVTGSYKWSASSGSFIQIVRDANGIPVQLDSIDPEMKQGEAYFVLCAEDISVNYDGAFSMPRTLAGIGLEPSSASVSAGGVYELNKVKSYGIYSDGSTGEISATVDYSADAGTISAGVISVPAFPGTVLVKASCLPQGAGSTLTAYLALTVLPQASQGGAAQVSTHGYKCYYKLAPNVRVVDETTIITRSFDGATLVLGGPGASSVAAGDVVVGYYGGGYMRKVIYGRRRGRHGLHDGFQARHGIRRARLRIQREAFVAGVFEYGRAVVAGICGRESFSRFARRDGSGRAG
ncbi:MAG: hypothetical protein BWY32_00663 [bacterium ADurb.Bin243]|nr:MAG: hypothetical protein BWY32_00663 [bacterium ADurb.Bin243]